MFTRPGIFKCFWSSGVRWLELAGTSTEKNSPWFGPKVQRSRTCWSGLLVARRQRKIPRSTLLWFGYASCKMFREQNRTRAFVTGWWFGTSFIFRTLGMSSSQLTNVFQRGWNHQPDNHLCLSTFVFMSPQNKHMIFGAFQAHWFCEVTRSSFLWPLSPQVLPSSCWAMRQYPKLQFVLRTSQDLCMDNIYIYTYLRLYTYVIHILYA